jgi:hypothetical protein
VTIEEFFRKLRATPRAWEVAFAGRIRLMRSDDECLSINMQCPMAAVGSPTTKSVAATRHADNLGIPFKTAQKIMKASDNLPGMDRRLRSRLLRACGLIK